jgi:hypothetical protein
MAYDAYFVPVEHPFEASLSYLRCDLSVSKMMPCIFGCFDLYPRVAMPRHAALSPDPEMVGLKTERDGNACCHLRVGDVT